MKFNQLYFFNLSCLSDESHRMLEFSPGAILCTGSANETRHYAVTPCLIGWAQNQIDPCSPVLGRMSPGLILGLCPTNERRRYKVTTPVIRWAHLESALRDGINKIVVGFCPEPSSRCSFFPILSLIMTWSMFMSYSTIVCTPIYSMFTVYVGVM